MRVWTGDGTAGELHDTTLRGSGESRARKGGSEGEREGVRE